MVLPLLNGAHTTCAPINPINQYNGRVPGRILVAIGLVLINLLFTLATLDASAADRPVPQPQSPPHAGKRSSGALAVYRVVVHTPDDVAVLTRRYDVLEAREGNALFVLGNAATLADLQARGFDASLDARLTSRHFPSARGDYFGGYRTVAEHEAHMDAIAAAHPDLALVVDYGDSWRKVSGRHDGHDLKAICITRRRPQDCRLEPNADKPRFFLMAAIHARELSAGEMAWRWMDDLVSGYGADPDVTWLLDATEMWIAPITNPDGRLLVEQGENAPYLQRKNLNDSQGSCSLPPSHPDYVFSQPGVDLNRNASFQWNVSGASPDPCAQTYPGLGPASEPEQFALETLMRSLFADQRGAGMNDAAPITTTGVMLTLHSFGDLVLLPWGWTQCFGPCAPAQQAPNDAGLRAFAFRMSYFNGYATGQASELLYPASGTTDDWAYGTLGIPAFTLEIGPINGECGGFTPPYACQDGIFWPLQRDAFRYAAKVARQPYALVLGPSVLSITLSSSAVVVGTPVTLTAVLDDDAFGNNPQSIGRPIAHTIASAEVYIDVPPWAGGTPIVLDAQDGAFDDVQEIATGQLDTSQLNAGRHMLFVRGRDAAGHWGPVTAQWLFVTGDRRLYLPLAGR